MVRILSLFLLAAFGFETVASQILPKEDARLSYRLVGFSFPPELEVKSYRIEIAKGNLNSDAEFDKNVIVTVSASANRKIEEVPWFGSSYTWRVSSLTGKGAIKKSTLHHFSTDIVPDVDTNITRFRILTPAKSHTDSYFFLDGTDALYDMNGKPIWYLPLKELPGTCADLRISPRSTITFMNNEHLYEINYNGDVLWREPNTGEVGGDTSEHFHHEFMRLSNGHYMALGSEYVSWNTDVPVNNDTLPKSPGGLRSGQRNRKTVFGTLIEYDELGKIVWSWKASAYYINSDLREYTPPPPLQIVDVHENGFYFDEKEEVIYLSCKNINRIIKIKYPEGTVLNSYGEKYHRGAPEKGNGMFCGQHCVGRSSDGFLYVYNNNSCNSKDPLPQVVLMAEPGPGKDSLVLVWRYECTTEGLNPENLKNPDLQTAMPGNPGGLPPGGPPGMHGLPPMPGRMMNGMPASRGGGSVNELKDHSFFVSMSGPYGKIFIVNRDKKVLWCGLPEKWNPAKNQWQVVSEYRANIIENRKQLEQLIWNNESHP